MTFRGYPQDATEIIERLCEITEREGLSDYRLRAAIDVNGPDNDWYAAISINEKVRFFTEDFLRQDDLLYELYRVPGLHVTPHEGPIFPVRH